MPPANLQAKSSAKSPPKSSGKWIWANKKRGDVIALINGQRRRLRLSLAALAKIEACYNDTDILQLIRSFALHGMTAKDADNIVRAALQGGGDEACANAETISVSTTHETIFDLAHELLERSFALTLNFQTD